MALCNGHFRVRERVNKKFNGIHCASHFLLESIKVRNRIQFMYIVYFYKISLNENAAVTSMKAGNQHYLLIISKVRSMDFRHKMLHPYMYA